MGHIAHEIHNEVHGIMLRSEKMASYVSSEVGFGAGESNKNDRHVIRFTTWRLAITRRWDNWDCLQSWKPSPRGFVEPIQVGSERIGVDMVPESQLSSFFHTGPPRGPLVVLLVAY